jgi:hypothetical protein
MRADCERRPDDPHHHDRRARGLCQELAREPFVALDTGFMTHPVKLDQISGLI